MNVALRQTRRHSHMPKTVLDYASPTESGNGRPRWWIAFVIGAGGGYVVALVLLEVLRAGGPIFPMTVLFAPVAVFIEWVPVQPTSLQRELEAGGPLLYGLYATALVSRKRRRNVSIAAASHVLCFVITLWQRGVL